MKFPQADRLWYPSRRGTVRSHETETAMSPLMKIERDKKRCITPDAAKMAFHHGELRSSTFLNQPEQINR